MATRPQFIIEPMRLYDIPAVMRIERASFPSPWSEAGYRRELTQNDIARYFVLRHFDMTPTSGLSEWLREWLGRAASARGDVIGYAGYWLHETEAHITTIAIDPAFRRQSLGEWLLVHVLADAIAHNIDAMTLEVRDTNEPARNLYAKYGFKTSRRRRRYYADGEDALRMSRRSVQSEEFKQFLADRRAELSARMLHGRKSEGEQHSNNTPHN